jgi:hypothetical protein
MERAKNDQSSTNVNHLKDQIKKFNREITNIKGMYQSLVEELGNGSMTQQMQGVLIRIGLH